MNLSPKFLKSQKNMFIYMFFAISYIFLKKSYNYICIFFIELNVVAVI